MDKPFKFTILANLFKINLQLFKVTLTTIQINLKVFYFV